VNVADCDATSGGVTRGCTSDHGRCPQTITTRTKIVTPTIAILAHRFTARTYSLAARANTSNPGLAGDI
jgi:hypothetical protein